MDPSEIYQERKLHLLVETYHSYDKPTRNEINILQYWNSEPILIAIVKLMENIGWQADDRFEPASTDIQNSKSLNLGQKLQASKIGQNYQFRK